MNEYVNVDFKPIKHRRLMTSFHCQELLYDYVCGRLPEEYKDLVERSLKEHEENQNHLRSIQYGIHYCKELALTEISNDVYDSVSTAYGLLPSWLDWLRWRHWPHSLRWSSEALLVSLTVAMVVTLVPWKRMWKTMVVSDPKIVLSEVVKERSQSDQESPLDEVPSSVASQVPEANPSEPGASSGPAPSNMKGSVAAQALVSLREEPQSQVEVSQERPATTEKRKGYVYRGFMRLKGLEQITPEIVRDIEALGGEKAGSVPLGWRKTRGSYFHFAMEEARYEELLSALKMRGEIRIYKDDHVRVMPEGQIRIILWIEEGLKTETGRSTQPQEGSPEVKEDGAKGPAPDASETSSEGSPDSLNVESKKESPVPAYRDGEETPIESEGEPLHE